MVRLGEGSEVIIAPKDRKRKSKANVEETQEAEEIKRRQQAPLRIQRIDVDDGNFCPTILMSPSDMRQFTWDEVFTFLWHLTNIFNSLV